MKNLLILILAILPFGNHAEENDADSAWVQIRIPVACMREEPGHPAEMSTQAIMGMPMLVLEDNGGEWLRLKAPDGYEGYVNISSLARKSQAEIQQWRKSPRLVSMEMDEVKVYSDTSDISSRNTVTELVNGSIVEGFPSIGRFTEITLPDGRKGFAPTSSLCPVETWASQPFDAGAVLERCHYLTGTPYLWGGCSTKSVDCSGLVRVALYANGILTLRDARQQIDIGTRIEPDDTASLRPADLMFFSSTPDGRIGHVAVYDGDGRYIHSSGLVKVSSMSPDDPDWSARCYRGASRIEGMTGTPGIWQISSHPWYF